jgi:hypothetical protein
MHTSSGTGLPASSNQTSDAFETPPTAGKFTNRPQQNLQQEARRVNGDDHFVHRVRISQDTPSTWSQLSAE